MSAGQREPRPWLLSALALLVVACVYARVLEGPFLWDDRALVLESRLVREGQVAALFRQPFWLGTSGQGASDAYYRPLTSLTFLSDHALHGDNASGFHLTNLLLHLGCVALLFALLRRRGADPKLAFLLSACWGLLPRLTEAAAWISGRTDLLATLLTLAALWLHRPGSLPRLLLASLLAFLALLSKETGVAAVLALLLVELSARSPRYSRWTRLAAPLLALGAYVALRASAGAWSWGGGAARSPAARALSCFEALGRYLFMVLNPMQPRSLLGRIDRPSWLFVTLGAAALVALVLAFPKWRRAAPQTRVWLLVATAPLLLVLHLTALPVTVVAADRYLYLPSAALLVAAAPAVVALSSRVRWLSAALLALTFGCGVRSFQRVGDYADEARFWAEAARVTPEDATPLIELGAVAYRAGAFEDALRLSHRAIPLDLRERGQALDNAALAAMAAGQRELAAELASRLVAAAPRRAAFRLRRAAIALNAGDLQTARAEAERARQLAPELAAAARFLELVQRAERARSPSLAEAQALDIASQRHPELAERLENTLQAPGADAELARQGVEALVVEGAPEPARALLTKYRERFGSEGTERLEWALEDRSERARAVHERVVALVSSPP
ncbi:MAG: hypothetical protein EOO73_29690 [Myxococcales bacterium]|nr:MAG: hypothetical protein EOO73_29690 [Myxococcales bacterium]